MERHDFCKPCRMTVLLLKPASESRPFGEWDDHDFDVLADGAVVGRIVKTKLAPEGQPWMWVLSFLHHEGRTPTLGVAETREAATAALRRK